MRSVSTVAARATSRGPVRPVYGSSVTIASPANTVSRSGRCRAQWPSVWPGVGTTTERPGTAVSGAIAGSGPLRRSGRPERAGAQQGAHDRQRLGLRGEVAECGRVRGRSAMDAWSAGRRSRARTPAPSTRLRARSANPTWSKWACVRTTARTASRRAPSAVRSDSHELGTPQSTIVIPSSASIRYQFVNASSIRCTPGGDIANHHRRGLPRERLEHPVPLHWKVTPLTRPAVPRSGSGSARACRSPRSRSSRCSGPPMSKTKPSRQPASCRSRSTPIATALLSKLGIDPKQFLGDLGGGLPNI